MGFNPSLPSPPDRHDHEEHDHGCACGQTCHEAPGVFACGDASQPRGMEDEVQADERDERVTEPSMQGAPLVARVAQNIEAPAVGPVWKTLVEQPSGSGQPATDDEEGEVERAVQRIRRQSQPRLFRRSDWSDGRMHDIRRDGWHPARLPRAPRAAACSTSRDTP